MSLKHLARQHVPWGLVRWMRRMYYLPRDTLDVALGRRDPLTPPLGLRRFIGQGGFQETGDNFLRYFIEFANLQEGDDVLDVGCGIGRMAVPLTRYLNAEARYEGFDIVPEAIRWCQKNITARHPNFGFHVADIYNGQYNPSGRLASVDYRFPFDDATFDFVFVGSVFTHMLRDDMRHYLSETARVLRSGGRCLATAFLLNDEARALLGSGQSSLDFHVALDGCYTIDAKTPERAVAYEEDFIRGLCADNDLVVTSPIRYGSWCGRERYETYSDIVVMVKNGRGLSNEGEQS